MEPGLETAARVRALTCPLAGRPGHTYQPHSPDLGSLHDLTQEEHFRTESIKFLPGFKLCDSKLKRTRKSEQTKEIRNSSSFSCNM